MIDPVTAYARRVVSGKREANIYERLACQRHLEDLEVKEFFYDAKKAAAVIGMFGNLRHYKAPFAGQPFVLDPSQQFIIGSLYGWLMHKLGPRRFTFAYTEIPRKNGKTTLSAGVGIHGMIEERGAEVYSVATKEDQAKIGWRDGRAMIRACAGLRSRLALRVKEIRWEERESFWRPLGSDSETLDGLNPSTAIYDELHAWSNRDLLDVIEDGMGAREQPLGFAITTAGSNQHGICMERRNLITAILEGRVKSDRTFGIIFTADEGDDPHDPRTWAKANPLLGVSKRLDYMHQQSDLAKATPGKLNTFLTKQLNIWVQADERWLDLVAWDKCAGSEEATNLAGLSCSAGLDLSSTTDITALVRCFRINGRSLLVPTFWIPEESMKARVKRDRVPYDLWVRQGFMRTTPGDVVDYDFIIAEIRRMHEASPFTGLAFDPWNATAVATRLQGDSVPVVTFRQGFQTMSPASKEFEKRLMKRELWHMGNPVLRWMAGHVAKEEDAAGNIKPSKKRSRERIDGIVASIMAVGHDMMQPTQSEFQTPIWE
jgi:phage terminase large subunit-like protein